MAFVLHVERLTLATSRFASRNRFLYEATFKAATVINNMKSVGSDWNASYGLYLTYARGFRPLCKIIMGSLIL